MANFNTALCSTFLVLVVALDPALKSPLAAQTTDKSAATAAAPAKVEAVDQHNVDKSKYVLGPQDQISIWALETQEIAGKTFTVDQSGTVSLPMVGRMQAAGLTVEQFEIELTDRLKTYLRNPQVAVGITQFGSQPVSVVGSVSNPGVLQLQGGKTLLEVLTLAGGLKPDAGTHATVMRRLDSGRIPLPNAADDPSGRFSIAEVNLRAMLESEKAEENIILQPYDVITVPQARLIYVIGSVGRSGSFPYNDRDHLTVLQALSLAGGATIEASPQKAKILRQVLDGPKRAELPVNLKDILAGKMSDIPLMPNDILLVPDSTGKKVTGKAIETAIQAATWMITWGIR